jgi:hypothetical protein
MRNIIYRKIGSKTMGKAKANNNIPDNSIELNENDLLKLYCSKNRGTSFREVSVGIRNSSKNSKDRRIDIVRIENNINKKVCKYSTDKELFNNLVNANKYKIELVEIKKKLNRVVIGQIIVGEYLFKKKFKVHNFTKAIVYHIGDSLLEEFCKENQIKLIKY